MRRSSFIVLWLALVLVGCGSRGKFIVPTSTVTGKVKWAGTPLKEPVALIGVDPTTSRACQGKVEADGSCQLLCGGSPMVPLGTYELALIPWTEPGTPEQRMAVNGPPSRPAPLSISEKYLDPRQSGWKVDVTSSGGTFDITVPGN
ncbi:MAG: hypothetical protein JWP89_3434 [Schlesneria sp.]|nr:hypothetical protein [Schlesneria sp.]